MNFTRKRALLACEFCRHRKKRCDGARPKCSSCIESSADCVYKELPQDRLEPSTNVSDRLTRIEALLEEQSQRLREISQGTSSPSFLPNSFSVPGPNLSPHEALAASPASVSYRSREPSYAHLDQAQFLIPTDHATSANSLLCHPRVRSMVGEYPNDYFYNLEASLPLPSHLELLETTNWPALDLSLLQSLAHDYFLLIHPHFPLFLAQLFEEWQARLFEKGPEETAETAICLCVYALGCLVPPQEPLISPELQTERENLGLRFFQPALRIILREEVWGFQPSLATCQALLLGSSYLAHLGRPLHSWKLAYDASLKFIHILDRRRRAGPFTDHDDNYLRVFWSCFMIECDRAAELDVPRSGIEPMADKMALPRSMYIDENDDILYFVAETAVRRLLNRIHSSLYSCENTDLCALTTESGVAANMPSLNKLLALSAELNRQLEEWYNSIPTRIRPPIGAEPVASDRGRVLRLRYYVAKHIIHRPFILYLALQQQHQQQASPIASTSAATPTLESPFPLPRIVLERCETCISSCRTYLYNVVEMLDKRTPYLWDFSQGALACLLVLMTADMCPELRHASHDDSALIHAMVLPKLRKWAVEGSSFEAVVKILDMASTTRGMYVI